MPGKGRRKNAPIVDIIKGANRALAVNSEGNNESFRSGIAAMLESILFSNMVYAGFKYLPSEYNADGTLKEVRDNTRREYFLHPHLTD